MACGTVWSTVTIGHTVRRDSWLWAQFAAAGAASGFATLSSQPHGRWSALTSLPDSQTVLSTLVQKTRATQLISRSRQSVHGSPAQNGLQTAEEHRPSQNGVPGQHTVHDEYPYLVAVSEQYRTTQLGGLCEAPAIRANT